MSRKVYRSKRKLYLRLIVDVNGKKTPIEFTGGTTNGSQLFGATFSTADPDIQKAIEGTDLYKSKQIMKEMEIATEGDQDLDVDTVEYPDVKNAQSARDILIEKYGLTLEELSGKNEDIIAKAKSLSVSFPNWPSFAKNEGI